MRKNDQARIAYTRLNNKTNNIHQIIGRIFGEPGISIDTINEVSNLQEEIQNINQQFNTIWNRIATSNQQNIPTSEFESAEDNIDRIKKEIDDLYERSINESEESKQIKKFVEFDKTELIKARDYHRTLSYVTLGFLGVVLVTSFIIIYCIYGLSGTSVESNTIMAGKEPGDLVYILTRLTGKISILIGIAWVIKYLGGLHSNHSQQYVAYQDRLSGLNTAEFILSSGKSSVREKVILQLADTYLSLKENAFKIGKEKQVSVSRNGIETRDVRFFAKLLKDSVKK